MTLLALALILAAVAVMVVVHFKTQKRLERDHIAREQRLEASVEARRAALDKQAKVFVRDLARSHNAAKKLIDQSRSLHDDVRQLHQISESLHREMNRG